MDRSLRSEKFGYSTPDRVFRRSEQADAKLPGRVWIRPLQSRLANISTRGFVDTGDNVLISAVIVVSGDATVVVRAIGPSLEAVGVSGALQDPLLEIHNPDGSILVSNDDWRETQEADIEASGIAPTDDREFARLIPELAAWNDGRGIDIKSWLGCIGRFDRCVAYTTLFWPAFTVECVLFADFRRESFDGSIVRRVASVRQSKWL